MAGIKATVVDSGRTVFTNLKYMYVIPWELQDDGSYKLGTTAYDIVNIVGDTTSVEQEDNEVNEIEHEFSSEPLYENITLGSKTFTAECIDFQNDVLYTLFGWTKEDASTGNFSAAPIVYKDLYCAIELGFNSTNKVVVLPKVKLNSKTVLSSMKTDASRATITGTCYSTFAKEDSMTEFVETDMFVIDGGEDGSTANYTLSETNDTTAGA